MAEIRVDIQGLGPLQEKLRSAGSTIAAKIMETALLAAGEVIAEAVRSKTPVRTGLMQQNVLVEVHTAPSGASGYVRVGFGNGQGDIARFVEYGHRTVGHASGELVLTAKNGRVRLEDTGKQEKGRVKPHPFFRGAVEQSKDEAAKVFAQVVTEQLKGVQKS